MKIQYINKDITTLKKGNIVHGVNCQGAMNSGIAKAIKTKWPTVYTMYQSLFTNNRPNPALLGKTQSVKINDSLYIYNAFTQLKYGRNGVYADPKAIESSLYNTILTIEMMGLDTEISMPMIGCGLGGLNWKTKVEPIVSRLMEKHDVQFTIYSIDK